jgi:hypothetical protein
MAEAARYRDLMPRALRFKGALQTVRAFEEDHLYDPIPIKPDMPILLTLLSQKRVGDRPDRYEPRAVKRRPRPHRLLTVPRKVAKRMMVRGIMIDENQQ